MNIAVLMNSSLFLSPGKVHGSLARAGKVRGQTPKVSEELTRGASPGVHVTVNVSFSRTTETLASPVRFA